MKTRNQVTSVTRRYGLTALFVASLFASLPIRTFAESTQSPTGISTAQNACFVRIALECQNLGRLSGQKQAICISCLGRECPQCGMDVLGDCEKFGAPYCHNLNGIGKTDE